MPQLVVSAGFAAAGFAIGGPAGAQAGWAIGSVVGGALFPPEGPRAQRQDTSAPRFDMGARMQRVYGTVRVPLSPRWIDEWTATEQESGGKGGGPTSTFYSYSTNALLWAADGSNVQGWSRIWKNGTLIASRHASSDAESIAASLSNEHFSEVEFFDGNAAQLPFTPYETAVGSANADGHRGIACLGFTALQGGNSPQMPFLEAEVYTSGTESLTGGRILYLQGEGSEGSTTIVDSSNYARTVNNGGGSVTNTSAQAAVGTRSLRLEGAGNQITVACTDTNYQLGTGDFIIRARIYLEARSGFGTHGIVTHGSVQDGAFLFYVYTGDSSLGVGPGRLTWQSFPSNNVIRDPEASIPLETWTDVEARRVDGVVTIYVNDAPVGSDSAPDDLNLSIAMAIGGGTTSSYDVVGYFDEVEIIKGDEVSTVTPQPVDLADIVTAECLRAGLTADEIDVTELEGIEVAGFIAQGTPREAIEQLMGAHFL